MQPLALWPEGQGHQPETRFPPLELSVSMGSISPLPLVASDPVNSGPGMVSGWSRESPGVILLSGDSPLSAQGLRSLLAVCPLTSPLTSLSPFPPEDDDSRSCA